MKKFNVGDKVKIPTRKSAGFMDIHESRTDGIIKRAEEKGMDFLYVIRIWNGEINLSTKPTHIVGERFLPEDLELYHKFKPGDKVQIPTKKSFGDPFRYSGAIKTANENGDDFLIVKYYSERNGQEVVVVKADGNHGGDLFLESDLVPYKERKFKAGDKVKIPTKKSIGCPISQAGSVNRAKENGDEYMIVQYYKDYHGTESLVLTSASRPRGGDFFLESDVELYVAEPKFKVGDKVKVPTQKTGGWGLIGGSAVVRRAKEIGQDFLYVTGIREAEKQYVLRETFDKGHGDFFSFEDVTEAYEEPIFFTKEMNIGDFAIKPTGDGFINPSGVTITPWEPEGYSLEQLVKDTQKQTEDLQELVDKVQKLSQEQREQHKEVLDLKEQVDRMTEPVVPGVDYIQIIGMERQAHKTIYTFKVLFFSGDVMEIEMGFSEDKLKSIWRNNQNMCGYVKGLFK